MGADTTSTQLIFFIAATVVATAAAGVMAGAVTDLVDKAKVRSEAFSDELVSEVRFVNDPNKIVVSPDTLFYVKNTGKTTLDWYNATLFVDGALVTTTPFLMDNETTFRPGAVVRYTYDPTLASGDHYVSISMENGVHHELRFRV